MKSMEQLRTREPPPESSAWAAGCLNCLPDERGEVEAILPGGRSSPFSREEVLAVLTQERERTSALVAKWLEQQRRLNEEQASQQERLLQSLLEVQRRTIQDLAGNPGMAMASQSQADNGQRWESSTGAGAKEVEEKRQAEVTLARDDGIENEVGQEGGTTSPDNDFENDVEELQKFDNVMQWWKRCSGLQTVEKWVSNYRKHPAGWAALLMIQGIPEVTSRLRSKVENYAIYSALFLSMSIALLAEKPSCVETVCSEAAYSGVDWWVCQLRFRLYFYGFGIGTAAHMLSIMLAMSFVNALNEAARDSDVYRMFARGKGFIATVRCQYAFRIGCIADLLAVATTTTYYIGWEAVVGTVVLVAVTLVQAKKTARLLFSSGSIVDYWREELGGKPDKDDPYDLQVPVGVFKETSRVNKKFFMHSEAVPEGPGSVDSSLWAPLQKAVQGGEIKSVAQGTQKSALLQPQQQLHAAAVAAIF